jgi:hypothetical protein
MNVFFWKNCFPTLKKQFPVFGSAREPQASRRRDRRVGCGGLLLARPSAFSGLTWHKMFGRVLHVMEAVADQAELFLRVEERVRRPSVLREWKEVLEREGPVMPQSFVKYVLDVSQQRVGELIMKGQLARVGVRGKWFVPIAAVEAFLETERKNGRPVKELSLAESYRRHLKKS